LLCAFFLFFTFEKEKPKPKTKPNIAGVILSFDDAYINDWFATDRELKKYSWKGTFFVCKINTLNPSEIKKLLELQKEGNEIGGHGLNHYNAATFLSDHTIDEYLDQEINPMLDLMSFYGLKVTSFAYPYGGRTKSLDNALLKKFKVIRGRAFCEKDASKQGCYFDKTGTVFSFSIDDTHNHFNIPHLLKLLDYVKKNNKILILNSHKTVKNVTGDYQTKNETLELICQYVKKNNMKFYTLSNLDNLK
jgi:peptidoglycan/xylan/chitin deacetylase (PgdA/CDA1 family)